VIAWLREHHGDPYVQKSREDGYRSRASYKLLEIHEKEGGSSGVARRSWTWVRPRAAGPRWLRKRWVTQGLVVASDILPMDAVPGVSFIQGDFTEQDVLDALLAQLGDRPVDLVISDMAPI